MSEPRNEILAVGSGKRSNRVCLVAIAKNEGKFLAEWIGHYISIGVDHVFIFDNESADNSAHVIDAASRSFNVTRIAWPSPRKKSPQIAAYQYALRKLVGRFDWVCFFDCDEFLVLLEDDDIHTFLDRYDETVGALAVNWLTFGSAGRKRDNYRLVTEAFRLGGPRRWNNNRHIKTIARVGSIKSMGVHACELKKGVYVHPNGQPVIFSEHETAKLIDHSLAQLNHYQIKSKADFDRKALRGRAGRQHARVRENPEEFFARLDVNRRRYREISKYRAAMRRNRAAILRAMEEPMPPPTKESLPARLRRLLGGGSGRPHETVMPTTAGGLRRETARATNAPMPGSGDRAP